MTAHVKALEANEVWRGDWIQTFKRKQFFPADPRAEDIDIEDIAHALSMQCRFSGHLNCFYSVAEHSIHVSDHCPPEYKLWGLLHDATEAYLVDVPRPLKPLLIGYREIEDRLMAVIAEKYGLEKATHMPDAVKDVDNRILFDERDRLMGTPVSPWNFEAEPLGVKFRCWEPNMAEAVFLSTFNLLTR